MKKQLLFALASAAMLSAGAADIVVYNNGTLAPGITPYGWWAAGMDFNAANPDGSDSKVYSFKADNGGADASMGLYADGTNFVTGPLHSATLDFSWYAAGTCKITIRLTADGMSPEQNYEWTVDEEQLGKWYQMSLPVATDFPQVSEFWNNYDGKGRGYVFGLVLSEATPTATVYFDNIRYSSVDESWKAPETPEIIPPTSVPAVAQPQDRVLSIFSEYGNHPFNVGGWGQATQSTDVTLEGGQAKKLTNFNYLGWELNPSVDVTGYDYVHVDFYPCEETTFGFTIISPGQEKAWIAQDVKLNEWNSYDAPLSFWTNVNLSDIFQMKFDQGKLVECYLANVYFWKKEQGEDPDPIVPEPVTGNSYSSSLTGSYDQTMGEETKTYPYSMDYTVTYKEDKTLNISVNFNWTDGEPIGIVPGSVFINNELNDFTTDSEGKRIANTTATYEGGQELSMQVYIPVANGVVSVPFSYVVGSTSNQTGIEAVEGVEAEAVYYNLQGVRVPNPASGIFIRVQGNTAKKIRF